MSGRQRISPDRRLGDLSPAAFLARHWQRKPLLIRSAFDADSSLPSRDDLFELASREDVESRLIATRSGRWTLEHGPFERLPNARRDWTLLVQGVNLIDCDADALMRSFDFLPTMRLDDVMMSYAADGGGVGPHLDSYDVFLLQVEGTRRWRWRDRPSSGARDRAVVAGMPVKLLAHFEPTHEALLEPGDMLYLPPSCAHEGVAVGPCITASIGFRAPSWDTLTREFLFEMAEREWPDGIHRDAGRTVTAKPAELDRELLAAMTSRLSALRFTTSDIETFAGRHFSEPKPHVYFDAPEPLSSARFVRHAKAAMRRGDALALDLRATMLYRGARAFVAGEAFSLPSSSRPAFRRLANQRRLEAAAAAALIDDAPARALLHEWWQHGWVTFDDGGRDGPS